MMSPVDPLIRAGRNPSGNPESLPVLNESNRGSCCLAAVSPVPSFSRFSLRLFPRVLSLASCGLILTLAFMFVSSGCSENLPGPEISDITCYAATYSKGVYRSGNGGISWFPLDPVQDEIHAYYKRLFLNPEDSSALYIATAGAGLYLFNIEDGRLSSVDEFRNENTVSVEFNNGSVFTGVPDKGIYKGSGSPDGWQVFNDGLTYRYVNILYSADNDIYAGTVKDLFKLDSSSMKWVPASDGIKNKNIISFGAGSGNGFLLAGAGVYGDKKGRFEEIPCLYKSADNGKTWEASDKGIPEGTLVYVIAVNPGQPGRIYLGTSDGIYRSTDKGNIWKKMEDGLPKNLKAFDIKIARLPDGRDAVYAAGSGGVYMTMDDDKTPWVSKSYGLEKTAITGIVLAGSMALY